MEQVITFRIGLIEKQKIKARAKVVGLDTASYCRHIVLKEISRIQEEVTSDAP